MTINSLRPRPRPDNLKNQARTSQSLARRLYLGLLLAGGSWIALQMIGPLAFLDADGLIMQDREVVGANYQAQVLSVAVHPGDQVSAGQRLATVASTQMIDLISDLTSREAQARSRREQIDARLVAIRATLPSADQRVTDSKAALAAVEKAARGGFTTATRRAEVAHERYEAARDAEALRADAIALESERMAVVGNLERLVTALDKAQGAYQGGAIVATVDGTVGPKVAAAGMVLRPGEAVAELHHGAKYVVAYLPINRFYSVAPGDTAVVNDGALRRIGRIARIEGLADALPNEFQSNFRSIERRQVARIEIGDPQAFPLLAKVNVSGFYAPGNIAARVQAFLTEEAAIALTHIAEASRHSLIMLAKAGSLSQRSSTE
jgi:multidrug efflux pump subunit AcrA (membrane-fusion protein)